MQSLTSLVHIFGKSDSQDPTIGLLKDESAPKVLLFGAEVRIDSCTQYRSKYTALS